jgi:hypothetical protein
MSASIFAHPWSKLSALKPVRDLRVAFRASPSRLGEHQNGSASNLLVDESSCATLGEVKQIGLHMNRIVVTIAALTFSAAASSAQEGSQDIAKDLANPLAAVISVPIQGNYNGGIGPEEDGEQYYVNVQPVIPISLSDDWNLISRTIVPIIWQDDIFPGAGSQFGL